MKDKNIWHYIFGILTGILFIPIIEEFANVIMAWIQVMLLKPNKIVLKGNKELSELQGDEEEYTQTSCIGFQIPSGEDEYYDEE